MNMLLIFLNVICWKKAIMYNNAMEFCTQSMICSALSQFDTQ